MRVCQTKFLGLITFNLKPNIIKCTNAKKLSLVIVTNWVLNIAFFTCGLQNVCFSNVFFSFDTPSINMPADSTIVQTTTNNVVDSSSDLHGLLSLVVGWWWVIILLAIIVLIGYTKKKWVVKFYRRVFIKFLIKMDKFIIIYNQWDILYSKGLYEQLINECNEADNNSEILEEEKEKINNYREKAETAKKSREISVLYK